MMKSESGQAKKSIVMSPHQLGAISDKPGLGLKLSQYSQLKGNRFKKEESEDDEGVDSISQSSSDVDSPNTKEQKRVQLIKEKEHMTNRMLSDFRQFVMLQKRQYSLNPDSDERNSSNMSSSLINNQQIQRGNSTSGPAKLNTQTSLQIMDPNENANSGRSLTKQASNISMLVPVPQQQQQQQQQNPLIFSSKSIQMSSQSISPQKEKHLLKRQNSIAQAMQKRLKIMHKSKEQLFNEKLKMFKGVSTYVETKQFLQGLNVLNSKKIAENMQQTIKLNIKYDIIHNHLQQQKNIETKEVHIDDEEAKRQRLAHVKYNKDNPLFQKNLHDLLGKAHEILQNTPAPVSENEVKAANLFENVKANIEQDQLVNTYEFSDENQFFDKLREELIKGNRRASFKQEETNEEDKKKVLRRTREQEILNEIYTSTELVEQLSQQQIKEFIDQRIEKEMNPNFDPFKNIPSKVVQKQLKNLNLNEKTNLDSKNLYSEYVERANQVRSRLHRLNQAFFKQKWANAMMKNKQEKEQIRNTILKKIQNAEVNSSKLDVLFPGKKKMDHIKSRVDSGLDNDDYEEQNKINISPSPSPSQRQVDISMHKNPSVFMDSPKSNHTISSNTHIRINSRQNIPKIISNLNSGATSLNAISNINTAYSANFMKIHPDKNQNNQDVNAATPNLLHNNSGKKELSKERNPQSCSFTPFSQNNSNQSGFDLNRIRENSFGQNNLIKKHSHTVSVPNFQKPSPNSFYLKPFLQKPVNNPMSKTHQSYHHHSANTSAHFLPLPQNLSRLGSMKQNNSSIFNNTTTSIGQNHYLKNDSNRSLRKITSIHYQENMPKDQSKQQLSMKQSPMPINLRAKKMSNSPRNSSQQSQFFEQPFEFNSQKERLTALLGGIEAQRASRKKESKQIGKELSEIQINCEEDLRKLKGEPIDHIQNVLDINFFKFSKDDRTHISDVNIKRFLNKND